MITLSGKRKLADLLFFGLCTVRHGLFALPLNLYGRLYSVIVAFSGYLLYYFAKQSFTLKVALRKHAYSNILKISPQKLKIFR